MNRQDPSAAGFIVTDDHNGETAAATRNDFSNMLARDFDYFTEDDLFELMWQGGGGTSLEQPASSSPVSYIRLSPELVPPQEIAPGLLMPETLDHPFAPSEEEMAAWLYPIVSGEVAPGRWSEADDGRQGALQEKESMDYRPGALTTTKDAASDDSGEKNKQASSAARGSRTTHHAAGVHNLTEKRRRMKITERLRTLQRLVPGCDKSNQASTLDQTIRYMKSLQHQLKAVPVVLPQYMPPPPPAVTMPIAAAVGPPPPTMVPPFGAMLPYPPYPAVLLPAAPLYRQAAIVTPSFAARRHGSSGGGRSKSWCSLRQKK